MPDATWRAHALDVLDELEGRPRHPLPVEPIPQPAATCAGCERLRILISRARAEPGRATDLLAQALA